MSRIRKGDRVVSYDVANEREILATGYSCKGGVLKVIPDDNKPFVEEWQISGCEKVTDLLKMI